MVHALIDVKGTVRKTRCGLVFDEGKSAKSSGWVEGPKTTAWESDVTCSKCKKPRKV
jgi:rubredoxin